jgi:hypothetical protein
MQHEWWRRGMHILVGYSWVSQKERYHWEDQDIGAWIIFGEIGWSVRTELRDRYRLCRFWFI